MYNHIFNMKYMAFNTGMGKEGKKYINLLMKMYKKNMQNLLSRED